MVKTKRRVKKNHNQQTAKINTCQHNILGKLVCFGYIGFYKSTRF